ELDSGIRGRRRIGRTLLLTGRRRLTFGRQLCLDVWDRVVGNHRHLERISHLMTRSMDQFHYTLSANISNIFNSTGITWALHFSRSATLLKESARLMISRQDMTCSVIETESS